MPTGEKHKLERPKDQWGNEAEANLEGLPDDAPAKTGQVTGPSGQGGATPHDGISYQDKFSPNPPPAESAAAKGKENDEVATGDTNDVTKANERLAQINAQAEAETKKAKSS